MISFISIILIIIGTLFFSILYMISVQPATLSLRIGNKAYKICGYIRLLSIFFEILVIYGYILFIFGKEYNYSITAQNDSLIRIIGSIFTLITLGWMFYGVYAAGNEASMPRQETRLYTGIYYYMRHPQTLGEMLSWFGISMILNSLTLLVYSIIWIPLFISYTIIEDNDLAVRFGDEYIEYTKKVKLFWKRKYSKK